MNESAFKEILGEAIKSGLAEFDNAPEHKFSLKHRLAMKYIFAKFARNVSRLKSGEVDKDDSIIEYKSRVSLRQRLIVVLLIFILLSFLVGWVVVFVSDKFSGTVYSDNTQLTAVDVEDCPNEIEIKYIFASVPSGFDLIKTSSSPTTFYILYENSSTGQTITLRQWVKAKFKPRYNTERHNFEEVIVNGKAGLYIDFSYGSNYQTLLVWDNTDYILEVVADLTKSETIDLVKFDRN